MISGMGRQRVSRPADDAVGIGEERFLPDVLCPVRPAQDAEDDVDRAGAQAVQEDVVGSIRDRHPGVRKPRRQIGDDRADQIGAERSTPSETFPPSTPSRKRISSAAASISHFARPSFLASSSAVSAGVRPAARSVERTADIFLELAGSP